MMKRKYRVKVVTSGHGKKVYVQYKDFLFWHYFRDVWELPIDYGEVEVAMKEIEANMAEKKVEIINFN